MKRIDTADRDIDKHGAGRDGFQYLPAPTEIDDTILDHIQEELARAVELSGITLNNGDLEQLAQVLLSSNEQLQPFGSSIVNGFAVADDGGLDVVLSSGSYIHNGVRVWMSDDVIDSIVPGGVFTVGASRTSYLYMLTDDDPSSCTFELTVSTSAPTYDENLVAVARIVSGAASITSISMLTRPTTFVSTSNVSRIASLMPACQTSTILPNGTIGVTPSLGHDLGSHLRIGSQYNYFWERLHVRQIMMRARNSTSTAFQGASLSVCYNTSMGFGVTESFPVVTIQQLELTSNAVIGPAVAINPNNGPLVEILFKVVAMSSTVSTNYNMTERSVLGSYNRSTNTWAVLNSTTIREVVGAGSVSFVSDVTYSPDGLSLEVTNNAAGTTFAFVDIKVTMNRSGALEINTIPDF